MYYFSIFALITCLVLMFVTAWRVDAITDEYSSAIVNQVKKLGVSLEIPNQVPLNYRQKHKIIRDVKQIQVIKDIAQIRVLEARYRRAWWVLGLVFGLSFLVVIASKSGKFF